MGIFKQEPTIRERIQQPHILGYLFITPLIMIIFGLVGFPCVDAVWLSLTHKFVGQPAKFIGFENYHSLMFSPAFINATKNTFVYTFVATGLKMTLGLAMALTLNFDFKGVNAVRGILLISWVIPTAISALIWMWMYDDMVGIFNFTLIKLGLIKTGLSWLGNSQLAMPSVIAVNVWRDTPFFGLSFLAALKTVSPELYEAARTDGASVIQRFFHIALPLIKPVALIVTLLSIMWTFADFQIVYIMTKGGPAGATHIFSTFSYEVGFIAGNLGKATAIPLLMTPFLAVFIILITRLMEMR
ncbi:MAG: sugar ABC transporter permease [Candidatus Neomarinimicrobiota bacterium]|nr:MAG: sugar ABC transporter permease [Candidatus Neomarinimicrobiota bacterium]